MKKRPRFHTSLVNNKKLKKTKNGKKKVTKPKQLDVPIDEVDSNDLKENTAIDNMDDFQVKMKDTLVIPIPYEDTSVNDCASKNNPKFSIPMPLPQPSTFNTEMKSKSPTKRTNFLKSKRLTPYKTTKSSNNFQNDIVAPYQSDIIWNNPIYSFKSPTTAPSMNSIISTTRNVQNNQIVIPEFSQPNSLLPLVTNSNDHDVYLRMRRQLKIEQETYKSIQEKLKIDELKVSIELQKVLFKNSVK